MLCDVDSGESWLTFVNTFVMVLGLGFGSSLNLVHLPDMVRWGLKQAQFERTISEKYTNRVINYTNTAFLYTLGLFFKYKEYIKNICSIF